jgi:hypothetical protein
MSTMSEKVLSTIGAPGSKPVAHSSSINLAPFALLGVLLAAWAYTGFMGPTTLLSGMFANEQCVRFAKERVFTDPTLAVRATNLRIRNNSWVVTVIAAHAGSKDLSSRICVVDGETITLPSIFESGFWR